MRNKIVEMSFLKDYKRGIILFELKENEFFKSILLPRGNSIIFTSFSYEQNFTACEIFLEYQKKESIISNNITSYDPLKFGHPYSHDLNLICLGGSSLDFRSSRVLEPSEKCSLILNYFQKEN